MAQAHRRIRSELGVPPSKHVTLLARDGSAETVARLQRFDSQLRFLTRLESIEVIQTEPPAAAAARVGDLNVFVPLEGLVDLDAERSRLEKELKKVAAERAKSESKLASETFVANAPAAVVEQERARLVEWNAQFEALSAQRARLG